MDKENILKKLSENIQNIEEIDNQIAMVGLAIYQKNIEKIKSQKIQEIRNFFNENAKRYNQKSENFSDKIDNCVKEYSERIDCLIESYDNMYLNVFKIMQNALDMQKISIANIVTLLNAGDSEEIKEKVKNSILAYAEQKLNYSIVVQECAARSEWCIENVKKDIEEVFIVKEEKSEKFWNPEKDIATEAVIVKEETKQLQMYNKNIINKITEKISNIFLGKSKYKKFLENYENEFLKKIDEKNKIKIIDTINTMKGVINQMAVLNRDISVRFEECKKYGASYQK